MAMKSKSPQDSPTHLNILASFNNNFVWIVSPCPLCPRFTLSVPSAPTIIGINVTVMIHRFFSSLARSKFLYLFSICSIFILWSARKAKSTIWQVLIFCWLSLALVVLQGLADPFVSQNPREVYASHYPGRIIGCEYSTCSYDQIRFFAQLPANCFYYPLVSRFILFLLQFTTFTYDKIDCFFSVIT